MEARTHGGLPPIMRRLPQLPHWLPTLHPSLTPPAGLPDVGVPEPATEPGRNRNRRVCGRAAGGGGGTWPVTGCHAVLQHGCRASGRYGQVSDNSGARWYAQVVGACTGCISRRKLAVNGHASCRCPPNVLIRHIATSMLYMLPQIPAPYRRPAVTGSGPLVCERPGRRPESQRLQPASLRPADAAGGMRECVF